MPDRRTERAYKTDYREVGGQGVTCITFFSPFFNWGGGGGSGETWNRAYMYLQSSSSVLNHTKCLLSLELKYSP